MSSNYDSRDDRFTEPPHGSMFSRLLPYLIVAGVLIVAFVAYQYITQARERSRRIKETHRLVNHWARQLDKRVVESGKYDRHKGKTLPAKDAWGRDLSVLYKLDEEFDNVTVTSSGPDEIFRTADDISEKRRTGYGKQIGKSLQFTGKNFTKGVIQGFKEEFKRDKNKGKKK